MLHCPPSEKLFPNVQPKPPKLQLVDLDLLYYHLLWFQWDFGSIIFVISLQVEKAIRLPFNFLFARLIKFSSPNLSSQDMSSRPLPILVSLQQILSSFSTSQLNWSGSRFKTRMQYSRCTLAGTKCVCVGGITTALDLLAMFLLISPSMQFGLFV